MPSNLTTYEKDKFREGFPKISDKNCHRNNEKNVAEARTFALVADVIEKSPEKMIIRIFFSESSPVFSEAPETETAEGDVV